MNRTRPAVLVAAVLAVLFVGVGPASADVPVASKDLTDATGGARVVATLMQKGGTHKGVYVSLVVEDTRKDGKCGRAAVRWRTTTRRPRYVTEYKTWTPRIRRMKACDKGRRNAVGATPLHYLGTTSAVSVAPYVDGGPKDFERIRGWGHRVLRAQADRYMSMTYGQFVRAKQASRPWPFDWSDDGCSVHRLGKRLARRWSHLFNWACQQHDFGYRNYGKHFLMLGHSEGARGWIDRRLRDEAKRSCNNRVRSASARATCRGVAETFYQFVSKLGKPAFNEF